jgi:ABC-2 type transport system permease protein
MRLYVEVARRTYARISTYRGATLAGVFTNTVFGFLLAYVLLAVYDERRDVGGFDAIDAVTFVFVAQGLLMVLGMFSDTEIADRVRTGDVIVDLQRPYDHQAWWAGVSYGKAVYYVIFRGVPPFVVGALVFHLRLPTPGNAVAFAVSLTLAVAVAFGWRYLLQLSSFWLLDVRGANQLGWLAAQFLSGAFLPIVFFPDWLESVSRALPFASMLQLPVEVWLGRYDAGELPWVYAQQLFWGVVLVLAGRHVMSRAVRRVVVQGG